MKTDILIVGAGPAGSSAAIEAKKLGADVIIIDKKKDIGSPVRCGEFIPAVLLREINSLSLAMAEDCIAQKVSGIKTYIDEDASCIKAPGYILNRDKFDKLLAERAKNLGALLLTNTICKVKNGNKVILEKDGKEIIINPSIIIGADGPKSTVGKWINEINHNIMPAIQYKVKLKNTMEWAEIYLRKEFLYGYGWLFPKANIANIGIAAIGNLPTLIDNFITQNNKIGNEILSKTIGLVPVNGILNCLKDNIMLVGDAGGFTHPITGSGIANAIISGKIAGTAAANKIKNNTPLHLYIDEIKKLFSTEFNRAKYKRKFMTTHWDEFHSIIKKCFPTFKDYYEGKRYWV